METGDLAREPKENKLISGVSFGLVPSCVFISIPPTHSREDADFVAENLQRIWDAMPWRRKWIVDLSKADPLHIWVLGSLAGYSNSMLSTGHEIELHGLKQGILSPALWKRLPTLFRVHA